MQERKINLALLWSKYIGNVTSVDDLVLGLDKERFDVIFIYLSSYGVDKNSIEEAGYKVFYLSNKEHIRIFRLPILFKLARLLKKQDVDILHCHAHKATVYGTIAAIFAHTPVVMAHVHGLGRSRNFRRKLMNLLLFRKITTIIPVAESVKEDVLRNNWFLSPKKLSVLENSIDYKRFADVRISKQQAKQMLGIPPDTFIFGTIGRLAPMKGQRYLIEAFKIVKQKNPSAELVFIGEGFLRKSLEQQAAETGHGDSIHFLGRRNDVEVMYKAMDVFVLSSVASEGMPRAMLEAMACGVPCIATLLSGIPEVINDDNVGVLVPPKDSEALAKEMIELIKMPEKKRQRLVDNARQKIYNCYSHKVIMRKLENIYETELGHYYEGNRRQKSNV